MSDNINVAIRVRPLIQRELETNSEIYWESEDKSIWQKNGTGKYVTPYYFDRVFGMHHTTDDVFSQIAKPIVQAAMKGINGTIFAYGQTASGKTYTMNGSKEIPGIIPQVVHEIFQMIENTLHFEFLLRVSYCEIYNETVVDLLGDPKKALDIREDTKGNVFVASLKEELVNCADQILALKILGEENRHVGSTGMNEKSSRSHTIFRVIVESKEWDSDGAVMVSHINLVDLAGSEKAKQTGATGQRLTEGGFINKSLFILGNVISQLSDCSPFVSYRDSRLTRILKNSLGGNSKTAIICNVTPASLEETHSSLRFATSAKRITNKPIVNEVLSEEALLKRYKKEIDGLKKQLDMTRNPETQTVHKKNEVLKMKLAENEQKQAEQEEKILRLTRLICVSSRQLPTSNTDVTTVNRKRRETWCPGKRLALSPKPSVGDDMLSLPPRSLSPGPGPSARWLSSLERVEILLPELVTDVSTFSNEEEGTSSVACQTELVDCVLSVPPPSDTVTEEEPELQFKESCLLEEELQGVLAERDEAKHEVKRRTIENNNLESKVRQSVRLAEELLDEVNNLNKEMETVREDKERLEVELHMAQERQEKREREFTEMEEFLSLEHDVKNESIMIKSSGQDMMAELQLYKQTAKDSQIIAMDSKKALSMAHTEVERIANKMIELKKEADRLGKEKDDFTFHLELEREKFQRREADLTEQLEEAYLENSAFRAAGAGSAPSGGLNMSLQVSDTKEVERLCAQIAELTDQLQESQREQAELRDQLDVMTHELQEEDPRLEELGELQRRVKSVSQENKQLEEELQEALSKVGAENDLKSVRENLWTEAQEEMQEEMQEELHRQILAVRDEAMLKLDEAKAVLADEHAALQMKVDDAQSQVTVHQKRVAELEAALQTKVDDGEERLSRAKEEAQSQVTVLQNRIDELKVQLQDSEKQCEVGMELVVTVNNELDEAKLAHETTQHTVSELQQEIQQLQRHLEGGQSKGTGDSSVAEIKTMKGMIRALKSERDDARDVCDTIDDELEEAKKQLRVAEEKIATLQQGHGDLVKRLEKHEAALQMKVDDAQSQVTVHQKRVAELEAALQTKVDDGEERLSRAKEEAQSQVTVLQNRIDELEVQLQDSEKQREVGMELVVTVNDELDESKLAHETTQHTVSELQQEIQQLQRHLQGGQSKGAGDSSVAEIKKMKGIIRALKSERDDARDACDTVDDELEEAKKQLRVAEEKIATLQQGHGDLVKRLEKLKASAEQATLDRDEARNMLDEVDNELDEVKKGKEKADQEIATLKGNLRKQHDSFSIATMEAGHLRLRVNALQTELALAVDPLKDRIRALERDNSSMKQQVVQYRNDIRKLKNDQPDNSMVVLGGPTVSSRLIKPEGVAEGGSSIVSSVKIFTLEAEKKALERHMRQKDKEIETFKKSLEHANAKVAEMQKKVNKFQSHYKKELSEADRNALKDMVNSPKRLPTSKKVPTHGMKTSGAVPSSVAPWQDAPPVPFLLEENAAAVPDEMASQCPQQ